MTTIREQTTRHSKRSNRWKIAFFALLSTIILTSGFLLFLLTAGFSSRDTQMPKSAANSQVRAAVFTIQAEKAQLQRLINERFAKKDDQKLSYRVTIGDRVTLSGDFRLLFTGIPFSLTFIPRVSGGDVILRETDVKLGKVRLPDEEVLAFLQSGADLPKWIVIQPKERQIYVKLTDVQVQKGLYLRADTINLPDNQIIFSVHERQ